MAYAIKNILVNRIHDRAVVDCGARHLRGRLVDIGCGAKPYAAALAPYVESHVGVDHPATPHGRVEGGPARHRLRHPRRARRSFDGALCTAVLEHLEEPEKAIRECHRVLKPGGVAVYSVPFIWHLHEEPRDFFRFSKYGLRYLFEKVRLRAGRDAGAVRLLHHLRHPAQLLRLPAQPRPAALAAADRPVLPGDPRRGWLLDRLSRDERYTWMYVLVARKVAA